MQRSALCRSRRELSDAYFLAKFGFDTIDNEPCKVCPLSAYRYPRLSRLRERTAKTVPPLAAFLLGAPSPISMRKTRPECRVRKRAPQSLHCTLPVCLASPALPAAPPAFQEGQKLSQVWAREPYFFLKELAFLNYLTVSIIFVS